MLNPLINLCSSSTPFRLPKVLGKGEGRELTVCKQCVRQCSDAGCSVRFRPTAQSSGMPQLNPSQTANLRRIKVQPVDSSPWFTAGSSIGRHATACMSKRTGRWTRWCSTCETTIISRPGTFWQSRPSPSPYSGPRSPTTAAAFRNATVHQHAAHCAFISLPGHTSSTVYYAEADHDSAAAAAPSRAPSAAGASPTS
jgi:hypothetical protein